MTEQKRQRGRPATGRVRTILLGNKFNAEEAEEIRIAAKKAG